MGKYFGTDGFRGKANIELTVDHAYKIGRFLGWFYQDKKSNEKIKESAKIVIGKDTRRSSYMLEYALAAGITASGSDAYLLHVTTTASVAYITKTDDFDCGIMISASHNPYFDNGIKLINNQGEKMDDEVISLIENYLDGNLKNFYPMYSELPLATEKNIGRTVDYVAGRNRYVGYLISLGQHSFKGFKIGLDCANGSAWMIAKSVFDALGAKTYLTGAEPNGFNINEDCGSTHIENLQKFVTENSLDAGFAFDGDADRCFCIDENGKIITGDHILYIYAKYLKERRELDSNTVVTTVMSNFGLYKALDDIGIKYVKTSVGDKYVYDYMMRNKNEIGGEQSGHIIFSKYASTGDGILTGLKMMEVMCEKKKSLGELSKEIVIYPQVLINVRVKNKKAVFEDPEIKEVIQEISEKLSSNGRLLVRESGTEPVIRIMAEGEDKNYCQMCVEKIAELIQRKYGP